MADDQYDFNDDKLPLSADPDLDAGSSFDTVESPIKSSKSKRPLVLGLVLLLVVGGAGAFFASQYFMGDSDMPVTPIVPPPMQVAQNTEGQNPALPTTVTPEVPSKSAGPATAPESANQPNPQAQVPEGVQANATALPVPADATQVVNNGTAGATAVTPVAPGTVPATPETAAATNPSAMPVPVATPVAPVDPTKKAEEISAVLAKAPDVVATTHSAVPAPPDQQLKPVDPNDIVAKTQHEEENPAAVIKAVKGDVNTKTADTVAAVNDILGQALPESNAKKAVNVQKNKAPPPPVEVTSRAQQVISVKKAYSAQSPQAMNAAGERVLQQDQYDAAIDIFGKQLHANPSDPMALAGKAEALQRANRDQEAMDTYQRLIDLNPRDVEALTNYLGLLQKQKPQEAMTRLNKLSEQYPDNAAVAGQVASVFASQMDTPNALRYFMKARALDPTNSTYPYNIGVLYDRMGNSDKASEFYHTALSAAQAYPDNSESLPVENIRDRLRKMNH